MTLPDRIYQAGLSRTPAVTGAAAGHPLTRLPAKLRRFGIVTDLNTSPKWEINIGIGVGPTAATDHLIVKGILGRRFDWGRHSKVE
jgi:hypothetical protein